jgi:hypothetical protein
MSADTYFGACPVCGRTDGYMNVGGNHWFVCDEHKTAWPIGYNLFSSWEDETPEIWAENERRLACFSVVQPIYPPHPDRAGADKPADDKPASAGGTP